MLDCSRLPRCTTRMMTSTAAPCWSTLTFMLSTGCFSGEDAALLRSQTPERLGWAAAETASSRVTTADLFMVRVWGRGGEDATDLGRARRPAGWGRRGQGWGRRLISHADHGADREISGHSHRIEESKVHAVARREGALLRRGLCVQIGRED